MRVNPLFLKRIFPTSSQSLVSSVLKKQKKKKTMETGGEIKRRLAREQQAKVRGN